MERATPPGRSDRGMRPREPRQWMGVVILCAWLVGWALGEWFVVERLFFSDDPGGEVWFLALWLLLWTAGGLLALRSLFRLLAGRPLPPPPPEPPDNWGGG